MKPVWKVVDLQRTSKLRYRCMLHSECQLKVTVTLLVSAAAGGRFQRSALNPTVLQHYSTLDLVFVSQAETQSQVDTDVAVASGCVLYKQMGSATQWKTCCHVSLINNLAQTAIKAGAKLNHKVATVTAAVTTVIQSVYTCSFDVFDINITRQFGERRTNPTAAWPVCHLTFNVWL